MDDATLIARILARDKSSLSAFYRKYAPRLSRFISVKIGNKDDAEEVLQDTLFAFLEAIRDFQGKSKIDTFLFSICNHKIIDYYRRKKFKHIVFSQMPNLEALISPVLNPEEELDITLLKEKTKLVFSHMLPQYAQVLKFKYIESLSVEEIARKLSTSFKSAESQLFRARKAFVEAFLSI